jgi:hypothetical protein
MAWTPGTEGGVLVPAASALMAGAEGYVVPSGSVPADCVAGTIGVVAVTASLEFAAAGVEASVGVGVEGGTP